MQLRIRKEGEAIGVSAEGSKDSKATQVPNMRFYFSKTEQIKR